MLESIYCHNVIADTSNYNTYNISESFEVNCRHPKTVLSKCAILNWKCFKNGDGVVQLLLKRKNLCAQMQRFHVEGPLT